MSDAGSGLSILRVPWTDPRAEALRSAQLAEVRPLYHAAYGVEQSEPGPHPTADDVPVFLIAELDGVPVACGGLRPIDGEHGEVKRMYAAPEARGTGAAVAVLRALEDEARGLGWNRLVLETGDLQHAAIRFYAREGYTPIPPYGPYTGSPYSLCFGREL